MGGSIAVVVRDHEGVIHRQGRWTNGLSTCFNDLRFFQGDKAFLKEYLTRESAYGPWDNVAPMGYGLVLADCVNRVLIDWQGYTAQLGGKFYEFCFNPEKFDDDEPAQVSDDYGREQAIAFINAGLAKHVLMVKIRESGQPTREVPIKTIEDVDALARSVSVRRRDPNERRADDEMFRFLVCDIGEWTYIRYEETRKGLDEMKAKVLSLGFELSPADEAEWATFIKERLGDE